MDTSECMEVSDIDTNAEGGSIFEFGNAVIVVNLWLSASYNSFFRKPEDKLTTYKLGFDKSAIDYIQIKKVDQKLVKNVRAV